MKSKVSPANRASSLFSAVAGSLLFAAAANAQEVHHLSITQPGGMPGLPVMTGVDKMTNGVTVHWEGPSGYYELLQSLGLGTAPWQTVAGPTTARSAAVTNVHSQAFFRVSGPAPQYAGFNACAECHQSTQSQQAHTRHASAFVDPVFVAVGGQMNDTCLQCHTVGLGLPTGFVSATDYRSTNLLAGVQCENCHGPAANHAANPDDPIVRPIVDVAATVCGGCHSFAAFPTYLEWEQSGHAEVTEENMNPNSCGRCHIGPARISMLYSEPVNQLDRNLGVVCAVCHDPHSTIVHTNELDGVVRNPWTGLVITNTALGAVYTNQVRNPFASTNDYFLTTSDNFATKYDPTVNMCGQCHNHRGATWQSTSRPPHHSPQYNILIGTVGELPSGSLANTGNARPATHALLEKQCVTCHMQMTEYEHGPPEVPAYTGHNFTVNLYEACTPCHLFAEDFVDFTQAIFADEINKVKLALDEWALVKQGGMLGTNYYGALCWEYTNPGALSSGRGPSTADQALIPDNIKKARFNLYLVLYDGSYGVHNGRACADLLDAADAWVQEEMVR